MPKKYSLLILPILLLNSTTVFAQFDWGWGGSYSIINNSWTIPTPDADAYMQNYQSGNTGSAINDWGVDTTNNVVLPDTHEYVNNGDGTSSIKEKTGADYSKYGDDEIVKPFQYPDDATPIKIEFSLDVDDYHIFISLTDGTEYPDLDLDPYDDFIYEIYDFDGKPGGKYARTKVGERVLKGIPDYGFIYPDAFYAVIGYPTDDDNNNTTGGTTTGYEYADESECESKTPVTFGSDGKVLHDPSGIEVKEAYYNTSDKKIYYVLDGEVQTGTYGVVTGETGGCINTDPDSFALIYPESVTIETGDTTTGTTGDTNLIGNPDSNITDPNTVTAPFNDVLNISDFNSIRWLYSQGVVEGYSDGTFKPDNLVNRAEFLKMLYETVGLAGGPISNPFPDVPSDTWYTKYVLEAYKDGIVQGYDDGYFRPENTINFAEAVKIVANFFLNSETRFTETNYDLCVADLSPGLNGQWYWKYFHVADSLCVIPEKLLTGISGFDPATQVTRLNMADLLYRAKAVAENNYQKFTDNMIPVDVY